MPPKNPADLEENPYYPPGPEPLVFDDFTGGLNTNASRPGINDNEMAWCDGFFPLGKNNLRTLWGIGPPIYGTIAQPYLAFAVEPSNAVDGVIIVPPIVVVAHNADTSIMTTYQGPITIAILSNPGGATLSGTTTKLAVNGVATFSDISINNPGAGYTLIATADLAPAPLASITINYVGPVSNKNIKADALSGGWNGVLPVNIIVNVVSGTVGSTSTLTPALSTGTGFPVGMPAIRLTVAPGAVVQGMGGAGADEHNNGAVGGPALRADVALSVVNNGSIWAGGGGAGGGGPGFIVGDANGSAGGGGGGGAGTNVGAGGAATNQGSGFSVAGAAGTATAGGVGGTYGPPATSGSLGGVGGNGGGPGLAGAAGTDGGGDAPLRAGGLGGAAGSYIIGNGFVSWLTPGDLRGNVS